MEALIKTSFPSSETSRDPEIIPPIDIRSMTGDTDEELKEQLGDAWAEGVEYKYYAWSDRFQD